MLPLAPSTRMVFVTGKGGVGKSTVSRALALRAVQDGRHVMLCEVGPLARAPELFDLPSLEPGNRCSLAAGLDCLALDPDAALREWLGRRVGRAAAALLTHSEMMFSLVAAAPGARELTTIGKAWDLGLDADSPLVIVDGPATGHALALLRAPTTFGAIADVGPIGHDARAIRDSLDDPAQTTLVAVTAPTELAVAETLHFDAKLHELFGRGPDVLVINNVLAPRFDHDEARTLNATLPALATGPVRAGVRAALAYDRRRTAQQTALAGLDGLAIDPTITLPPIVTRRLALTHVARIGELLSREPILIS